LALAYPFLLKGCKKGGLFAAHKGACAIAYLYIKAEIAAQDFFAMSPILVA
jgi:hypothetical protein